MYKSWTERFNAKVQRGANCWEWLGSKFHYGHGSFRLNRLLVPAHRIAYEMEYGKIPDGLWVLHKCDNPGCVRPDHLVLGTAADNARDMAIKGRAKNGRKKLAVEDAYAILWRAAAGETPTSLAIEYHTNRSTVSLIAHRKTWPLLSQSHD